MKACRTLRVVFVLTATLLSGAARAGAQQKWVKPDSTLLEHARRILESAPLIDGHNDLPSRIQDQYGGSVDSVDFSKRQPTLPADVPRLRAGRVGAQFW